MRTIDGKERGYYLLELAAILPITMVVTFGLVDIFTILTAYGQMMEVSNQILDLATRVNGEAVEREGVQHKPTYHWYRYTHDSETGKVSKTHVATDSSPPAACMVGGATSCVSELASAVNVANKENRSINVDTILNFIANDGPTRVALGELAPTCDIEQDSRCLNSVIIEPGEGNLGSEEIGIRLTANVPTIFLHYMYKPFAGQDYIQISSTSTKDMEANFLQQSPLILNHMGSDSNF